MNTINIFTKCLAKNIAIAISDASVELAELKIHLDWLSFPPRLAKVTLFEKYLNYSPNNVIDTALKFWKLTANGSVSPSSSTITGAHIAICNKHFKYLMRI